MNHLKRYIKFHLRFLFDVYCGLLLKLDEKPFALFFNLNSILISSSTRLSWDGEKFVVTDKYLDGFAYKIRHQRQCFYAYKFGVRRRADSLADDYFLNKIEFKDGDTILDCGANVGDLKIWFTLKGKKINYIGFEPSPIEFNCLRENVAPGVAHHLGLWNKNGELDFFVSSQGADSSLIEPISFEERIKVSVVKLEDFVNSPIKMLKLEAEGAEPEILEGLGEKVKLVEYISADLGYERGINLESTLVPVTNYLLEKGFELLEVTHGRICALYRNKNLLD